jgi:exopolysaccharide biosynthesis polyprenyl glycosylphosphotransferase
MLMASHSGRAGDAAIVFCAIAAASAVVWGKRSPLHLVRFARFAFELLVPTVGMILALLVSALADRGLTLQLAAAPLLFACVVACLSHWLEDSFDAARPVRVAVVGNHQVAENLAREINDAGLLEYVVIGSISDGAIDESGRRNDMLPCLATLERLSETVVAHDIDILAFAPTGSRLLLIEEVANSCLGLGVRLIEASTLYEDLLGRVPVAAINAAWFQYLMHPYFAPGSAASKRAVDVAIAGALGLLALPFLVACGFAIRIADGGPAVYRQRRVGARGREFDLLKLRTMRVDAEADGLATWATADDARVTTIGRFLRRGHLDELPQLWNVLKGEMSLVGPRPERPAFVDRLERAVPFYERRHMVKPGLTGWAQVRCGYGGTLAGTEWKLCHDLYYLKRRCLLFDLVVMIETAHTLVTDAQPNRASPSRGRPDAVIVEKVAGAVRQ